MRRLLFGILALLGSACIFCRHETAYSGDIEQSQLRQAILKAEKSYDAAAAYRAIFIRKGFVPFLDDPNTGIALQAHWEFNKSRVLRDPPIRHRADWVIDKQRAHKFLSAVKARAGVSPPEWWARAILNADVFPGEHLAFTDWPELKYCKDEMGVWVAEATSLSAVGDKIRVTVGKDTALVPKGYITAAPPSPSTRYCFLPGERDCVIAEFSDRGYPFTLYCVDLDSNEISWASDVWAVRRGASSGPLGDHSVEFKRSNEYVLVFGAEGHGVYLEAFNAVTGEPAYRFCSCYWFNFSESWGLPAKYRDQTRTDPNASNADVIDKVGKTKPELSDIERRLQQDDDPQPMQPITASTTTNLTRSAKVGFPVWVLLTAGAGFLLVLILCCAIAKSNRTE